MAAARCTIPLAIIPIGTSPMRRQTRKGGGRQAEIEIEAIGGRGDGLGTIEGRPVFVPGALTGDRVRVRLSGQRAGGFKGEILELLTEGPGRAVAPCPQFGPCGGCTLQHLAEDRYLAWKQSQVVQALQRQGLPSDIVRPLLRVAPGTRRRIAVGARLQDRRLVLGYRQRERHSLVEADPCLLVGPELRALFQPLRAMLGSIVQPGETIDIDATATETGLDLLFSLTDEPDLATREAMATFAREAAIARVSWRLGSGEPEPLVQHRPPVFSFGGVAVTPPPGGFVQPTAEGEAALVQAVLDFLPDPAARVADLFAGCGTFSFPLAARCRVHAVEGDAAALEALSAAVRRAGKAERIETERRDLAQRPLSSAELDVFDCVLFDPPRRGAKEQAARLAGSRVPAVIAVSCNANSFARDGRILANAGLRLREVRPIDQFPWSGHVELVARFERPVL